MPQDPTPPGAPGQSTASLAARLRAEIRAEIEAGLSAPHPAREPERPAREPERPAAPTPATTVASLAATASRTIPATDGRPEIPLPPSASRADLTLPSALTAGLTFTYRISDKPKGWDDEDTSAIGYLNAHVNFAAEKLVTIDVRQYDIIHDEDGCAVTAGTTAAAGDEVSAGILWINPRLLALVLDDNQDVRQAGITVGKVKLFAGTEEIYGVRFEHGTQWTTYDLETGLLLSLLRGKNDPNETKEIWYLGRRTLSIPWATAPPPEWIRHTRGLTYLGSNTIVLPTALRVQTVTLNVDLEALHPDVVLARVASHIDNGLLLPPEDSSWEMVCAPTMLHPLWISPAAVRDMYPGQVIDEDPTTRFTITFRGLEGFWVALADVGPHEHTTYYFDVNSGMLIGYRGQRPSSDGEGVVQTQQWLSTLQDGEGPMHDGCDDPVGCTMCHGSGRCSGCGGAGCHSCGRTGECPFCN